MRLKMLLVLVSISLVVGLLVFPSASSMAYVPDVGEGVCVGNCPDESTSSSGGGYVSTTPYVPSGPSPEQLRQQREEKDLGEAAQDASDSGVEAYKSGDYASAVKYLTEALEYAPDDSDIQHNLDRAREALRQSEAARELKSVQRHSQTAATLADEASSMEARRGFDTAGDPAGSLDVPAVNATNSGGYQDPKVPTAQRTWAITNMEWKREALKQTVSRLEKQRQKLDPAKDAVKIAEIKQKVSEQENKIHFLNFSITEELRKAPAPKSAPAKSAH